MMKRCYHAPAMHPLVVHCKKAPYDVYIGRSRTGNPWGNPFSHLKDSLAEFVVPYEEVLPRYQAWLLAQPELVARARRELRGKRLGCWCAPKPCHGDILARVANDEELTRSEVDDEPLLSLARPTPCRR